MCGVVKPLRVECGPMHCRLPSQAISEAHQHSAVWGLSRDPGDHDDWDRTGRICCRLGIHGWNGHCAWLGWGSMVSPGVST
jgi:hypothetical protein